MRAIRPTKPVPADRADAYRAARPVRPGNGVVLVSGNTVEGVRAPTLEDVTLYLRSAGLAVRKLPEQLVVWCEPLPRTASGKIVRSRLVMESPGKTSQFAPRLRETSSHRKP